VDVLSAYLSEAPVSIGLIRAVECQLLRSLELSGRVLDVGCGDGLFAEVLFGGRAEVELAGVDTSLEELARAGRRGLYRHILLARAQQLPFPDNHFDVVLSNSVLEHIPHPENAVCEMRRVLKPGGVMVLTVPSVHLADFFFYTILLRKLGLAAWGRRYADFKNRSWKHYNLWSRSRWVAFLEGEGFAVERAEYILSRGVTIVGDILLPFAVPSVVVKRFLHRLLLWPNRLKGLVQGLLLRPFMRQNVEVGAGIFFLSRRQP
jgi:ubiquinone/menaquinone biosynthesis C-methylase UbiE